MFKLVPAAYSVLAFEISGFSIPDSLTDITTVTGLLSLAIAGSYLLIMPAFTFFYLQKRWYVASSIERLCMYFLVFVFFPGLLLLSPFLNFRPRRRQIQT